MKVNRWLILSVGLLFVLLISSFVINRIFAQNNNTIYGCYKRNNGQLRVVSGSGNCHPSENEISWSSNNNESTFEDHHQSLVLTAPFNEPINVPIPKNDTSIRLAISVSRVNFTAIRELPSPPPYNAGVTLIDGTIYYESAYNQINFAPATETSNYLNGNPTYEYIISPSNETSSNTASFQTVTHQPSGMGIVLWCNGNNLTLNSYYDTGSFQPESPLVTYKINMWY